MTENQKEQLFAYCDSDCTGTISEKEFTDGWEALVQSFLEQSADSVGLSRAQILGIVVVVTAVLGLLVGFILITLAAYQNESNFNSVIQSMMITGAGKAAVFLRKKGKGEKGNVDDVVSGLMDGQQAAASQE